MHLALGIDTGGTYTDAVLVNHDDGSVLAGAKSLTTRHNLAEGVAGALSTLFQTPAAADLSPRDIGLASISTTLATNALAEGHSGVVTLFLIGYDERLMKQYGFSDRLATDDVIYVRGGHNERGEEVAPLDLEKVILEVRLRRGRTEAFAVSGYFSIRNPAHELQVREVIAGLSDCPVSCGHQLSSRLNAVRRATTAALNAHLILPLAELIRSVRHTLSAMGISAPLMVVKGDGALIRSEIALQRPIETILSGPAASVVGAWHLAGCLDAWVVDVGGTTTDIAVLSEGTPRLSTEGAQVAGWRTMVETIDVHTTGLGGDSHVRTDGGGNLLIGPGRVIPICLLASRFPDVKTELKVQEALPGRKHLADSAQFLTRSRDPGYTLSVDEQELAAMLQEGPQSLLSFVRLARTRGYYRRGTLDLMEQRGLVRRAAFTPTDALHVLGKFRRWDDEAAQLAASLIARQLDVSVRVFCERVVSGMSGRIASELAAKALEDSGAAFAWEREPAAAALLQRALEGGDDQNGELDCRLTLRRPVVAIGAPVEAYLPTVASRLNTQLVIPTWSEVANAIGAVAGSVTQRARISIAPIDQGERYRAYLPDGFHDFGHLEDAVSFVASRMLPELEMQVRASGAEDAESAMTRHDQYAPVAGNPDDRLYLGTELEFKASGRPSFARDTAPAQERSNQH